MFLLFQLVQEVLLCYGGFWSRALFTPFGDKDSDFFMSSLLEEVNSKLNSSAGEDLSTAMSKQRSKEDLYNDTMY